MYGTLRWILVAGRAQRQCALTRDTCVPRAHGHHPCRCARARHWRARGGVLGRRSARAQVGDTCRRERLLRQLVGEPHAGGARAPRRRPLSTCRRPAKGRAAGGPGAAQPALRAVAAARAAPGRWADDRGARALKCGVVRDLPPARARVHLRRRARARAGEQERGVQGAHGITRGQAPPHALPRARCAGTRRHAGGARRARRVNRRGDRRHWPRRTPPGRAALRRLHVVAR